MVRVFATLRRPPVRRLRLYAQGASSMEMTRQRRSALTQLITNGYAYKPQMHLGRAKSFICIYAFEPCADCCHLVRLSKTGLIHSRCVRWVGAAPWNSGTHNKLPDPATYSETPKHESDRRWVGLAFTCRSRRHSTTNSTGPDFSPYHLGSLCCVECFRSNSDA